MTVDQMRRDLLVLGLAAAGSAASATAPPAPDAGPADPVRSACPRDHGAVGDGQYRPLATRFATLAAAKVVFPFVTSLRQSVDWAGIQAALDAVEGASGRVVLPTGRWIISDTLRLPSWVTLEGESRWGSIIDNQNLPLAAPQLTNKAPSFIYVTIRNLTLNGGTHGIRVVGPGEVAGCVIDGVTAQLQTEANIEFSSLQTTVFRDCHLIHGRHGISVTHYPCNSVTLINTRLGSHSDASLRLRGADLVAMIGGSMEAGGRPGPATIDVETGSVYANAIAFRHVYFESTHRVLLRSRGTKGLSFDGCKFTGTAVGTAGFTPYRFDCGDDRIGFSNNFFQQPTHAPSHAVLSGLNENLLSAPAAS